MAERLTAFVVGVGAGPIPIVPFPTFALAVPSGEGDVRRSLLSLSPGKEGAEAAVGSVLAGEDWRGCDRGAGDFRVEDVEGIESDGGGRLAVTVGVVVEVDSGESNSTGLVRGVACMLVINFALEQ